MTIAADTLSGLTVGALGHVVLKVRDQARAEAFYNGILGLPIVTRWKRMTFFSLGDHHDFAVIALGDGAEPAPVEATGLSHIAFKIGTHLDDLRAAKAHLEAAGIEVRARDHNISQSLYMQDPDGNEVEVYVDTSDAWKEDPSLVARADPLEL